ncbi:MAG: DEAD/DEAH box helicase [Lentisphaerae bacterium]|nr:DEAD/DEAH box helicase [Lentisphaerota bacterium]MBT5610481.1 DEAD/DEAH box helicase [Lentisphaerota bacterium]MBT7061072.1 DEAD/DEAH box helicase [Lentisphaerota bacterium]MBT7843567.1 DEAD/DEAH box helicase [Lentisphaerota bacterium]
MEATTFLQRLTGQRFFDNQVVHVEDLPARPATHQALQNGLTPICEQALSRLGITELYAHQATSVDQIRAGRDIVIVTGTASGKTLCYTIPVIDAVAENSLATVLCIYPTKALAQDQLRGFNALHLDDLGVPFMAGTYDGDTPQNLRRKIRDGGNAILTNPDMLHQGILPQHARWNRFFTNLRYIIIDEVHAYRGVFGSHLANVMRRLERICRHYGSRPQFICSSATIANPREHAERICGREMALVDNDGSPRGPKRFVLWNPPPLKTAAGGNPDDWRIGGDRRSPLGEAVQLMTLLVSEGIQTIAFVRTRLAAELIFRSCRERLRKTSNRLANAVHAYRGGYLPEERREIERRLASREILGVASTNALELGIDIGSLDACILVGYPGTVASLWQQSGRAGRGQEESLIFLVAQNAPMDQFLMAHTEYLFRQSPEQAVVDPDNPHVTIGHLKCAANELPVPAGDADHFGPYAETILELLEEDQYVKNIQDNWYWASSEYPAATVNLRNIAGPVYTIQDEADGERVIGTLDEISALSQLHTHAVYIHGADTYFVNKLDIEQKIAFVEKRDLDYYTQSVQTSEIRIDEPEEETEWRGSLLGFGDVTVSTAISMFKKIRFHSRDSLGFEKLELPPQSLETVALWFAPPEHVVKTVDAADMLMGEALIGVANVLIEVAPLFVMCDTQDIGTVVDAKNLSRDALFLHDRYPGGMGYARRCLDRFEDIMATILQVVRNCSCEDGCPSCVGSATTPFAMTDLDSSVRGRIPNKAAALHLLEALLA